VEHKEASGTGGTGGSGGGGAGGTVELVDQQEQLIQEVEVEQVEVVEFWLVVGRSGGSGIVIVRAPGSANFSNQAQTQLQHYKHQLVVVKWLHSQFLELLTEVNLLFPKS
jgi:hypothetical protein